MEDLIIADLHIHSRYARGTSKNINLKNLAEFSLKKGLNLLAIGDVLHEKWIREVKPQLKEVSDGVYEAYGQRFIAAGEVATFFGRERVHHLIVYPSIDVAEEFRSIIARDAYLEDGRPIIKMSSKDFAEKLFDFCDECLLIPAHIWTPYFGVFGSKSGRDSLKEAYGDLSKKIYAIETGLSSDPEMNWAVGELENRSILSFSDAHSFWPHRIGRELTAFYAEPSFKSIYNAIRKNEVAFTVEVDPAYGKYHYDGHRNCGVFMHPSIAEKIGNICPICGKPLTLGVLHRVYELADKPLGYRPKDAKPFYKVIPLSEVLSKATGISNPVSKRLLSIYDRAVKRFGSEINILLFSDIKEIANVLGDKTASLIEAMRNNRLKVRPGYDGVYGEIDDNWEEKEWKIKGNLLDFIS